MKRGFAYLSLVVFVALGILAYKERRAWHFLKSDQVIKEDIYEAIIRHHLIVRGPERKIVFISFAENETDNDPPDRFIARFRDLPIEIGKVSAHVKDRYGSVEDKQGRSGVIIRLHGIGKHGVFKRTTPVSLDYWAWGQEGHQFHLELTESGWKITKVDLTFIT
ncbi:MAG: hypothetical protein ACREAB_21310 [Blastocatellia bacterium]